MIGRTISHYRITEKLGEGGMGVVYLAEDIVLGRHVAIKTLTAARTADNQHFRTRFLREARAVSTLSHPHIATIYDYGEDENGEPYIVMELIKGRTLGDLMLKEKLTIPRAIEVIKQVGEALSEAHHHGIIHRDIKPSNVAINERGNVKVLDFGLAKQMDLRSVQPSDPERQTLLNTQTREGVIVGTPMYLSPEQALGVEVDARSDIFSLGALLYECVAGKPPFFGQSPIEICAKVIRDDPAPPSQLNPDVPAEIDKISLKALSKKPDDRYQTADEMIAALTDAQAAMNSTGSDRTVTRLIAPTAGIHPTGALATLSDIFKRPRLSVGYVAAGIVILVLVVFGIWWLTLPTLPAPSSEAQQHYDDGVKYLQEGSYIKASTQFQRAIEVDDKFVLAHARLAEAYTELDYTDKAKSQMLRASSIMPNRSVLDTINGYYYDAILATVNHDSQKAINNYTEITRLTPNGAPAYLDLGRAFDAHDEIDNALAQYTKASELDRNNPAPWLRLGVLYGRRQDLAKANAAFDKAEQVYRDNQNYEGSAEVFYQRGYLFAQMSKIPEAQQAAEQSLKLATTEQSLNLDTTAANKYQQVRALLLLSNIAYTSGNTAQAQTLITQALVLARANGMEDLTTQGLLDLGYTCLYKRLWEDAERYARQAYDQAQTLHERNKARANLLLGSIYIQHDHADNGKPFIDQALVFYNAGGYRREISRCMIMLGRVQLLKRDFDAALKTLDDQLQLARQVEDPGLLSKSQAEVAAALSKMDFYPQSLARYTESNELNKQLGNPLNIAFALVNRGDMLSRLGRYDEAKADLEQSTSYLDQLSGDNPYKQIWGAWGHLYLARMYLSQGQSSNARLESSKALQTAAADDHETIAEINAVRGLIEVSSGQAANARKFFDDAIGRLDSMPAQHNGSVRLALAQVKLESGDAVGALQTALEAQKILATLHEPEHEWRAWLIAARANRELSKTDAAREQQTHARALLAELQRMWGAEPFNAYLQRADIQQYQKQLENL